MIGICGNIALGAIQTLPLQVLKKSQSKEIQTYVKDFFGVTIGAMAYQAITLSGKPFLLENRVIICLTAAVLGAAATKIAHSIDLQAHKENKQAYYNGYIFAGSQIANIILGAVSLYNGQRAFGFSAIAFSAISLKEIL